MIKLLLAAVFISILTGCAKSGKYVKDDVAVNEIKSFNSSPNSAKLYVGRESSFMGGGASLQILLGSDSSTVEEVSWLANDEFVALTLAPGTYALQVKTFTLGMETSSVTYNVEAKAKGMYVVRCTINDFTVKAVDPNISECDILALTQSEILELNDMDLVITPQTEYTTVNKKNQNQLTISSGEPDEEYKIYQSAVKIGTIQAFEDFIQKNPKSIYVNSAERNIQQLKAFQGRE